MISSSASPLVEAWKTWAVPWKLVVMVAGSDAGLLLDGRHRVTQRDTRLEVEGDGHRGDLAQVVDRQRPQAVSRACPAMPAAPAGRLSERT